MMMILTIALLVCATIAGYVAYAKIRSGQQHGEAFIDAMLARLKFERAKQPDASKPTIQAIAAPAPPVPPVPAPPNTSAAALFTESDVSRIVQLALERAIAKAPQSIQPAPSPAPTAGVPTMHPLSNAYQFDPPLPDASPKGFGLFYPVGRDPATGKSIPAGPPVYRWSEHDTGEPTEAGAEAQQKRLAEYDAAGGQRSRKIQEQWAAERYNGPIEIGALTPGDLGYLDRRVGDYSIATGGRSLFHDIFTGSNPEIARARLAGEVNRNQGLPYDQGLAAVIDVLVERHRKA